MGFHTAPDHLRIGVINTVPHDGGPTVTADLVCCIHCGYMFEFGPGMTKGRGWCSKCNGYLCGRRFCRGVIPCQHWMFGIENLERGLPIETAKPISASNPGIILAG